MNSVFVGCDISADWREIFPTPSLTLNTLTWKIWWASNNASRWQKGFNSAFKGLNMASKNTVLTAIHWTETCEFLLTSISISVQRCAAYRHSKRSELSTGQSKGKGKAIPVQARTGPEGSMRLRLPDFKTIGTWRW